MSRTSLEHHSLVARRLMLLTVVFISLGLILFAIWFFYWRFYETTDDCYVSGNKVIIQSQVDGTVKAYYADDTEYVSEGQLLVELDDSEYKIKLDSAEKNLALTLRNVLNLWYEYQGIVSQVKERKAEYRKAVLDFDFRKHLHEKGAISKQEYYDYKLMKEIAYYTLQKAIQDCEAKKAYIDVPDLLKHPLIEEAQESLKREYLNYHRCKIYSPTQGFIAQRSVQLGRSVATNTPLMAVIPLDQIWVEANYKETQLSDVRIGQKVKIRSDLWGRAVSYSGKVVGIVPGAGNVFSLLPPQNATGNWIKIVQRVPVKIALDQEEVKQFPLWLGLSMIATIDTHEREAPQLSYVSVAKAIDTTIFDKQLQEVEGRIQKIIQENFAYPPNTE